MRHASTSPSCRPLPSVRSENRHASDFFSSLLGGLAVLLTFVLPLLPVLALPLLPVLVLPLLLLQERHARGQLGSIQLAFVWHSPARATS